MFSSLKGCRKASRRSEARNGEGFHAKPSIPVCRGPWRRLFVGVSIVPARLRRGRGRRDEEAHPWRRRPHLLPTHPEQPPPAAASGETGDDGTVRLRAAPIEDGFQVEANAPGYLLEERSLSGEVVQSPQPASVVLAMYAAPGPTVELVVPVGFRGLVRVETRIQDDLPFPAGQRCFRYDVAPSGVVQVTGPACSGACRPSAPATPTGRRWPRTRRTWTWASAG